MHGALHRLSFHRYCFSYCSSSFFFTLPPIIQFLPSFLQFHLLNTQVLSSFLSTFFFILLSSFLHAHNTIHNTHYNTHTMNTHNTHNTYTHYTAHIPTMNHQFWGLGSIGWIGMISVNLVLNMRNPFSFTAPLSKYYHLWVWGYATTASVLMVVFKQIGPGSEVYNHSVH
jgi:hypothetical protein